MFTNHFMQLDFDSRNQALLDVESSCWASRMQLIDSLIAVRKAKHVSLIAPLEEILESLRAIERMAYTARYDLIGETYNGKD